jgi:hypothetical protein
MPLSLLADAGTPMMIVGFFHLTVGNFFIGLFEAIIVRLVFKVKSAWLFPCVIIANYASFIAGVVFLNFTTDRIVRAVGGELPIYSLNRIFAVLIVTTFIVTIIVEWPFYWLGTRSKKYGLWKSFLANVVANTASYWLLAGLYYGGASTPEHWGMHLVPASQITEYPKARIVYLSPDGANVLELHVGETIPTHLFSVSNPAQGDALGIVRLEAIGQWQLKLKKPDAWSDEPAITVGRIAARRATTRPIYSDGSSYQDWEWYGGMFVADLQNSAKPKWNVFIEPGVYPQVIIDSNPPGKEHVISLLEMPFTQWYLCSPTLLPNDELVFALGQQIMVADLDRGIVAAVAAGHSPVVVLDDEPNAKPIK